MSQVGGPQNYNLREGTFSGYEEEDHGDLFSQVELLIGMRWRQAQKQGHLCATYYKHTPLPLLERERKKRGTECLPRKGSARSRCQLVGIGSARGRSIIRSFQSRRCAENEIYDITTESKL
ncbi:hypothetical protein HNY73_002868 [Argiope bruennichi]|uniref:Uncharacterized protein n=1 Tax=Argiope bruennichi TaxID=94029 RepID=A0A8T0FV41_ARGBR|nr:hypothetical protein HNY73_002868 [Argiope bruennichi]